MMHNVSEILTNPFTNPQPAEVVQMIGDFAVTNSGYEWITMKVDGAVSFSSVWECDPQAKCLIRYEVDGEVVEHRLMPGEVLKLSATR
jgi:hypothetical protein